jgi:hypothetical protein
MGGFTEIHLRDKSEANIKKHNALLAKLRLSKLRFYSEKKVKAEYKAFVLGLGVFPEHLFPKAKIKTYNDFKKYWNPKALGEIFCPQFGSLTFDCYFVRTTEKDMHKLGLYLVDNWRDIESTNGSYTTFLERAGLDELELQILAESGIKENY